MDYTKLATKVIRRGDAARLVAAAVCLLLVFSAFSGTVARGANVTLTDMNSIVEFETGTVDGMLSWEVDGVEQLFRQWLWYRVGTGGPELSIDTLTHDDINDVNVSDGDFDPGNERLVTRYFESNGDFEIQVDYLLTGGTFGSGTSDVAEVITIINNLDEPLDFHLFQYSDFDLGGTSNDAFVQILGGNTARQRDVSGGPGVLVTQVETVVTPMPSHVEVGEFFLMPNIISRLQDANSDDLNDAPLFLSGPDDFQWAFQWDVVIPAGGTFIISKDKNISMVPEPGGFILAAMSLCGFLGFVGRRSRRGSMSRSRLRPSGGGRRRWFPKPRTSQSRRRM